MIILIIKVINIFGELNSICTFIHLLNPTLLNYFRINLSLFCHENSQIKSMCNMMVTRTTTKVASTYHIARSVLKLRDW